jgi:hypothetical protein
MIVALKKSLAPYLTACPEVVTHVLKHSACPALVRLARCLPSACPALARRLIMLRESPVTSTN